MGGFGRRIAPWLLIAAGLLGCTAPPLTPPAQPALRPIRFLLSFDDGPSARERDNPTAAILRRLADNRVQPGIKALYFVQTGNANGGATPLGRALLRRVVAEGHLLGFHTATPGHTSHTRLDEAALEASLSEGLGVLQELAGERPGLVRPPHWRYDARSFAAYTRHGLGVLMTDLSANDGKVMWPNFSLRRRSHFEQQLRQLRGRLHELPLVDGVHPVVVTFHDTNPFTAAHIEEYLGILVEGAARAGLRLDGKPFYDDLTAIRAAALARTQRDASAPPRIPGFWTSLYYWLRPSS